MNKIRFTEKLELNKQVLPANSGLGKSSSVTKCNSEGSYIKRPEWDKETNYYQREFRRNEWRGRYRTEEVTDIRTFSLEEYVENI